MTGWQPPEPIIPASREYIGREVAPMTAADIILIFIGVIGLLIAFGSFVIALLAFFDRDKDHKRKK